MYSVFSGCVSAAKISGFTWLRLVPLALESCDYMQTDSIVGTWQLLRWYTETDAGVRRFPFGEGASGYISYSEDGHVFVHLTAESRPLLAKDDPFGGTAEEYARAMTSHLTYAGTFDFHGDKVVHHVVHSSCQNWVGVDQLRDVKLEKDHLSLSVPGIFLDGEKVKACLDWRRAV